MLRRFFIAALAAGVCAATAVHAEDRKLTGEEIFKLLNGNTVSGTWVGTPYKSWYDPGGVTIYVEDGRPAQRGRWRVNYDTDEYESWWEQSGWSSYSIVTGPDGLAWLFRGTRQPFVVIEGNALD